MWGATAPKTKLLSSHTGEQWAHTLLQSSLRGNSSPSVRLFFLQLKKSPFAVCLSFSWSSHLSRCLLEAKSPPAGERCPPPRLLCCPFSSISKTLEINLTLFFYVWNQSFLLIWDTAQGCCVQPNRWVIRDGETRRPSSPWASCSSRHGVREEGRSRPKCLPRDWWVYFRNIHSRACLRPGDWREDACVAGVCVMRLRN